MEGFFQICLRHSWEELTDLLFRRYHNAGAVLEMPAEDGLALLLHAIEQEENDRIFSRWVCGPQYQVSFEEFKKALMRKKTVKSTKEILQDVENIMEAFEQERRKAFGSIQTVWFNPDRFQRC